MVKYGETFYGPPQRLTPAVVNLNKIYKLHYGEVRGDVLRPPTTLNTSCSEFK